MGNNLELPKKLTWGDLGHEDHSPTQAFGPDYEESDIGKNFELDVTIFGYQVGEGEVRKLVAELNKHLLVCSIHKWSREDNE